MWYILAGTLQIGDYMQRIMGKKNMNSDNSPVVDNSNIEILGRGP